MDASKRKADDSLNGNMTDEPAMKKANTNESVDDCAKNDLSVICRGYQAEATLSLTTTIESLETEQEGEPVLVGNHLKWYLDSERSLNNGEYFLSVWVLSNELYKYPFTFRVEFTLEAVDPKNRVTKTWSRVHDDESFCSGFDVLKWDQLLNDRCKFEIDGKITMTAKITVRISNFFFNFDSARLLSDVKIDIGSDMLFPLNKTFLAERSQYFYTMFFVSFKESNGDVVKLDDVDSTAFVDLINVIYVRTYNLKLTSVASVLELADRFEMLEIIYHCEKLLLTCERHAEPSLAERLLIASKYSLNKLEKRCLELCDSPKTIKEIRKSVIYEEMPDAMTKKLFVRLVDLLKV